MQQTRQHIVEILKEKGQATVEEIVGALAGRIGDITAVTVRHHLEILRGDGLVATPEVRRRTTPGRPQHIYMLTDRALDLFPNNYRSLAGGLLAQLKTHLSNREVNVILQGVANQMATRVQINDVPMPVRLNQIAEYLTRQGYSAYWEANEKGYVLYAGNCPYHHLTPDHRELCEMDFRLITNLLGGAVPRRIGHMASGDESCAFLIPNGSHASQIKQIPI
jgi:predicted ArsR family transcriptional regulator